MNELRGLRVLVTRPGAAGRELAAAIEAAGGRAHLLPALQIVAIDDSPALAALAREFPRRPLSVFISPNAVEHGGAWLRREALWTRVAQSEVAAVGGASAAALAEQGVREVLSPVAASGGEALLAEPAMAEVRAREVVIFRGRGGRETLARALTARGARVRYAEVYRRVRPRGGLPAGMLADTDVLVATSSEALRNLYAMAGPGGTGPLNRVALVLTSEASAAYARRRGHAISPIITPRVSNRDIVAALEQWQQSRT